MKCQIPDCEHEGIRPVEIAQVAVVDLCEEHYQQHLRECEKTDEMLKLIGKKLSPREMLNRTLQDFKTIIAD